MNLESLIFYNLFHIHKEAATCFVRHGKTAHALLVHLCPAALFCIEMVLARPAREELAVLRHLESFCV